MTLYPNGPSNHINTIREDLRNHPHKMAIITEWVAALRSGEYKQGKQQLGYIFTHDNGQTEVRHCCLGVLSCLVTETYAMTKKQEGVDIGFTSRNPENSGEEYYEDRVLPRIVANDLFGEDTNPWVILNDSLSPLASLNDGGLTFTEIAALIEYTYINDWPKEDDHDGAE